MKLASIAAALATAAGLATAAPPQNDNAITETNSVLAKMSRPVVGSDYVFTTFTADHARKPSSQAMSSLLVKRDGLVTIFSQTLQTPDTTPLPSVLTKTNCSVLADPASLNRLIEAGRKTIALQHDPKKGVEQALLLTNQALALRDATETGRRVCSMLAEYQIK